MEAASQAGCDAGSSEGAQAPSATDSPDQALRGPSAAAVAKSSAVVDEAQNGLFSQAVQGGHSQQAGAAAQLGLALAGEATGAHTSAASGLVANGAADLLQASREEHEMKNTPAHVFLEMPQDNAKTTQLEQLRLSDFHKYRRFAQKWLQRRYQKQRQQSPQQMLGQAVQPPPVQNVPPWQSLHGQSLQQGRQGQGLQGQSLQGQSLQGQSLQLQGVQQQQNNWALLHQQLQQRANLGLPSNGPYPSQHHQPPPYGDHPFSGPSLQGGHPPQAGMMAVAQRQRQAFALAHGMQPPARTVPPPSPAAARAPGEAIDLTDDTAAPGAAHPAVPLPAVPAASVQPSNDQLQDWRAYEAYTKRQQQYSAQQLLQLQQQQLHHHHQQQPPVGVHAHLQHMQMLHNGAAAGGVAQGVLDLSHQQQAMPYPQHAGHRTLPDYSNGQPGMKRPRYDERPRYEADENQAGTVTFSLISTSFFTAKIRKPTPAAVHTYFRLTPGATYEEKERRWKFPLGAHENLAGALSRQGVQVVPVPRQALAAATLAVEPEQGEDGKKEASVKLCEKMVPEGIRKHLAPFQKQGVEFVLKKEGRAMIADEMGLGKTIQAISCAAAYEAEWPLLIISPSSARYHWEHELLKWLDEDSITKKQIVVVCKRKQHLNRGVTKVVIISYELVNRMREELDLFNFGVVVCDECHYLKNQRAARTKAIVPLATKARRAILLSGTPALSRPSELFTQLNLLSAATWASFRDFGKRYCAGKKGKGKKGKFGADFSGASHIAELHALLRATVMVRRLKKNILKNLPPKERSLVEVHVEDEAARRKLQEDLSRLATRHDARLGRLAKENASKPSKNGSGGSSQSRESSANTDEPLARPRAPIPRRPDAPKGKGNGRQLKVAPGAGKVTKLSALPPSPVVRGGSPSTAKGSVNDDLAESTAGSVRDVADMTKSELAQERRSLLMKLFADTGTAKIPAVIRHVSDILADEMTGGKVLVFAHHRNVLDALEEAVVRTGRVEYIRIDGRTKPKDRQDRVDTFQTNPSVRLALLGLTAAGIGITLTAASRVVFAELYWTPAQLLQAEDRCHRIGQATVVKVQYLVAKGSLDDALWPLIQEKIKLLGEMVEGEGEANQMEVNTPDSKKPKHLSPPASAGASSTTEGERAAPDERAKNVPDEANGGDSATEKARATFQGLQASVVENAQELAVEDMRHELDDEGRREFFEEQGGDGDGTSKGGGDSDGYSSGYSDGGGGQDGVDNMVCDLADSDVEECDDVDVGAVCNDAQGGSWSEAQTPAPNGSPTGPQILEQEDSLPSPMGLKAAIAAAKASAESSEADAATADGSLASKHGDEVIDLLSGDEDERRIAVKNSADVVGGGAGMDTAVGAPINHRLVALDDDDKSAGNSPPPQLFEGQAPPKVETLLNGSENNETVGTTDKPVVATGDTAGGGYVPPEVPASNRIEGKDDAARGDIPPGTSASKRLGGSDDAAGGDAPPGIPASNRHGGNSDVAGGDAPPGTQGIQASNSTGGEGNDSKYRLNSNDCQELGTVP